MQAQQKLKSHLLSLPGELLRIILGKVWLLTGDTRWGKPTVATKAIQSLCRSSKQLCCAVKASQHSMNLNPWFVELAGPYLRKLPLLTHISISGVDRETPDMLRLDSVSRAVPNLVSLDISGGEGLYLENLHLVLRPWCHSLKVLILCIGWIHTADRRGKDTGPLTSWGPDLPVLETLSMVDTYELEDLDLSGCPRLRTLELHLCRALRSLTGLAGSKVLESVTYQGWGPMTFLDLSGCSNLHTLACSGNEELKKVDVEGCDSLPEEVQENPFTSPGWMLSESESESDDADDADDA